MMEEKDGTTEKKIGPPVLPEGLKPIERVVPTDDKTNVMPLEHQWAFYYDERAPKGMEVKDFQSSMKNIGSFNTIQDFWRYWNNLVDSTKFPDQSNLRLFKDGIQPLWEDPANINGGKWTIFSSKDQTNKIWSMVVLALIGERFVHSDLTCGVVLSIRATLDLITLWTKSSEKALVDEMSADINEKLQSIEINNVSLEFKPHQKSVEFNNSQRGGAAQYLSATRNQNNRSPGARPTSPGKPLETKNGVVLSVPSKTSQGVPVDKSPRKVESLAIPSRSEGKSPGPVPSTPSKTSQGIPSGSTSPRKDGPVPSTPSKTIQGISGPTSPRKSGPVPSTPSKTSQGISGPTSPRKDGPVPSTPSKTLQGIAESNSPRKDAPVPSTMSKTAQQLHFGPPSTTPIARPTPVKAPVQILEPTLIVTESSPQPKTLTEFMKKEREQEDRKREEEKQRRQQETEKARQTGLKSSFSFEDFPELNWDTESESSWADITDEAESLSDMSQSPSASPRDSPLNSFSSSPTSLERRKSLEENAKSAAARERKRSDVPLLEKIQTKGKSKPPRNDSGKEKKREKRESFESGRSLGQLAKKAVDNPSPAASPAASPADSPVPLRNNEGASSSPLVEKEPKKDDFSSYAAAVAGINAATIAGMNPSSPGTSKRNQGITFPITAGNKSKDTEQQAPIQSQAKTSAQNKELTSADIQKIVNDERERIKKQRLEAEQKRTEDARKKREEKAASKADTDRPTESVDVSKKEKKEKEEVIQTKQPEQSAVQSPNQHHQPRVQRSQSTNESEQPTQQQPQQQRQSEQFQAKITQVKQPKKKTSSQSAQPTLATSTREPVPQQTTLAQTKQKVKPKDKKAKASSVTAKPPQRLTYNSIFKIMAFFSLFLFLLSLFLLIWKVQPSISDYVSQIFKSVTPSLSPSLSSSS